MTDNCETSKPKDCRYCYCYGRHGCIVVNVGNTEYKANTADGHTFSIEMSKRTRANTYTADVYAGGTMIATGLEFRVEKEGFKSNDIL